MNTFIKLLIIFIGLDLLAYGIFSGNNIFTIIGLINLITLLFISNVLNFKVINNFKSGYSHEIYLVTSFVKNINKKYIFILSLVFLVYSILVNIIGLDLNSYFKGIVENINKAKDIKGVKVITEGVNLNNLNNINLYYSVLIFLASLIISFKDIRLGRIYLGNRKLRFIDILFILSLLIFFTFFNLKSELPFYITFLVSSIASLIFFILANLLLRKEDSNANIENKYIETKENLKKDNNFANGFSKLLNFNKSDKTYKPDMFIKTKTETKKVNIIGNIVLQNNEFNIFKHIYTKLLVGLFVISLIIFYIGNNYATKKQNLKEWEKIIITQDNKEYKITRDTNKKTYTIKSLDKKKTYKTLKEAEDKIIEKYKELAKKKKLELEAKKKKDAELKKKRDIEAKKKAALAKKKKIELDKIKDIKGEITYKKLIPYLLKDKFDKYKELYNPNLILLDIDKKDINYKYYSLANELSMYGKASDLDNKVTCKGYIIMLGLSEMWDVSNYSSGDNASSYIKLAGRKGLIPQECKGKNNYSKLFKGEFLLSN